MSWNQEKLKIHKETADLLTEILFGLLQYIKEQEMAITEYDASRWILNQFSNKGLATGHEPPIVAFRKNTSQVHYFPNKDFSLALQPESLIMIDLWARKKGRNNPYADITWMAYYGRDIPQEQYRTFNLVIEARDRVMGYIEKELSSGRLPTGKKADQAARQFFRAYHLESYFLHTTGHSIGFQSPHGRESGLSERNEEKLHRNLGYTNEPGLYFENRFGIRSEIDFYINDNNAIVYTTPIQREITKI